MNDILDISTLTPTTAQPATVMVMTSAGALTPISFSRLCELVAAANGEVGVRNYCALSQISNLKNMERSGWAMAQKQADTRTSLMVVVQLHKGGARTDAAAVLKPVSKTSVPAGRFCETFTIPAGTDYDEMQIKFNGSSRDTGFLFPMSETGVFTVQFDIPTETQGELEMRNISVHRGSVPVDWVPAWEDLAAPAAASMSEES